MLHEKQDSTLASFIKFYTNVSLQNTHLSSLNSWFKSVNNWQMNAINNNKEQSNINNKYNGEHQKYQCPAYGKKCNDCIQANHYANTVQNYNVVILTVAQVIQITEII